MNAPDTAPITGKIILVGFGPGAQEHMSYRARSAIAEADVVIGYSTYVKLVHDLLEGKEVIRKGMTEELDRCNEAWEHARQGKTVAVISSGDIGVYGMAGPTYEVLLQSGWRPGSGITVEVVPGATALSACAALVGAPLTHDFCSISLSDLLTPWPVIARRLDAAARADFVVALYNPRSGRRTGQIVEARRILLKHRSPETPVAVVKSAYRKKQSIQLTTLAQMADCDIGMLTTVLIGNSSTFIDEGLMITPRGYANKYAELGGETVAGEKAGRSLSLGPVSYTHLDVYKRQRVDSPRIRYPLAVSGQESRRDVVRVVDRCARRTGHSGRCRAVDLPDDSRCGDPDQGLGARRGTHRRTAGRGPRPRLPRRRRRNDLLDLRPSSACRPRTRSRSRRGDDSRCLLYTSRCV